MKKTFAFLSAALTLFSGAALAQQKGTPQPLTEAQIAAVLTEANDVDIENGKMAEKRASNPDVKAFGERMVKDHRQSNDSAAALVKRLNMKPEGSPMRETIKASGKDSKKKLGDLKGADFDRAYIDGEVAMHNMLLQSIDKDMMPVVKNEELRALLEKNRPIIASHLEHAKTLQGQLSGGK